LYLTDDLDLSIKTDERQRRGVNQESAPTYQIMGNRPVPNYRQFLRGSGNKAASSCPGKCAWAFTQWLLHHRCWGTTTRWGGKMYLRIRGV